MYLITMFLVPSFFFLFFCSKRRFEIGTKCPSTGYRVVTRRKKEKKSLSTSEWFFCKITNCACRSDRAIFLLFQPPMSEESMEHVPRKTSLLQCNSSLLSLPSSLSLHATISFFSVIQRNIPHDNIFSHFVSISLSLFLFFVFWNHTRHGICIHLNPADFVRNNPDPNTCSKQFDWKASTNRVANWLLPIRMTNEWLRRIKKKEKEKKERKEKRPKIQEHGTNRYNE